MLSIKNYCSDFFKTIRTGRFPNSIIYLVSPLSAWPSGEGVSKQAVGLNPALVKKYSCVFKARPCQDVLPLVSKIGNSFRYFFFISPKGRKKSFASLKDPCGVFLSLRLLLERNLIHRFGFFEFELI